MDFLKLDRADDTTLFALIRGRGTAAYAAIIRRYAGELFAFSYYLSLDAALAAQAAARWAEMIWKGNHPHRLHKPRGVVSGFYGLGVAQFLSQPHETPAMPEGVDPAEQSLRRVWLNIPPDQRAAWALKHIVVMSDRKIARALHKEAEEAAQLVAKAQEALTRDMAALLPNAEDIARWHLKITLPPLAEALVGELFAVPYNTPRMGNIWIDRVRYVRAFLRLHPVRYMIMGVMLLTVFAFVAGKMMG